MKTHKLKLGIEFWDVVMAGQKTFEVRLNDRGFQKGDQIIFEKVDKSGLSLLTESEVFEIRYVLSGWGLQDGHVAFSIRPKPDQTETKEQGE